MHTDRHNTRSPVEVDRRKLRRPPIPAGAVESGRLRALLDRAALLPLTLVVAPAGYGKTVALAQWFTRTTGAAAWLTLDPADGDLARLAPHLAAAIAEVDPAAGTAIAAAWNRNPEMSAADFVAVIDGAPLPADARPICLILDDAHDAAGDFPALLRALLRHPLARLRLVVSGRIRPDVPLHRLRLQGSLAEIGSAQLRLTEREVARIVERRFYDDANHALTGALLALTRGWPAGIEIALAEVATATGAVEAAAAVQRGSPAITRYLIDEVIDELPADTRDFVLRAALFDSVSPSLASALVDGTVAADRVDAIIDDVLDRELFVESAPGDIAFLPFFRQAALAAGEHRLDQDTRRALRTRAAGWYAERGMIREAVASLVQAGATDEAVALIERQVADALAREDWAPPAAWLDVFPPSLVPQRPQLLTASAWVANFSGRPALAEAFHRQLARLVEADGQNPAMAKVARGLSDIHRHAWFLATEQDPMDAVTRLAGAARAILPDDRFGQGLAAALQSRALACAGYDVEALADLTVWTEQHSDRLDAVCMRGLVFIAVIHWQMGRFTALAQTAGDLCELAESAGMAVSLGWAHNLLGRVAYERNHIAEAISHFEAVDRSRAKRHIGAVATSRAMLALALEAAGRGDAADAMLAEAHAFLVDQRAFGLIPMLHAAAARLALTRPGSDLAAPLASLAGANVDTLTIFGEPSPVLTRAMLLIAIATDDALAQAERILKDVEDRALHCNHPVIAARVWAMQAQVLHATGRESKALDRLRASLAIGGANGFRRTYVDLRPSLVPLLERIARRSPPPPGLEGLLADLRSNIRGQHGPSPTPAGQRREPPGPPAGAPALLTAREAEVLGLLCEHKSYKEIADGLSISPLTVKRHLNGVYAKLGVRTGREAVRLAMQRGWCNGG